MELENVVRMSLKVKIWGKNAVWVFVSYLHHIVKQYHTSAIVILILYNRSINTLIVWFILDTMLSGFAQFFQRKYKDKAELFVFEQHSSISFLNPRFEWIEWTVRLVGFEAATAQIEQKCRESDSKAQGAL